MKAITLYQPWATLVAIGAKKIETRSWGTAHRGPLAIHASINKKFVDFKSKAYICDQEPFLHCLREFSERTSWRYEYGVCPRGFIIATCELIGCKEIDELDLREPLPAWRKGKYFWSLSEQEKAFGDFKIGRFIWFLANIKILSEPIPAKGALGLWECNDG